MKRKIAGRAVGAARNFVNLRNARSNGHWSAARPRLGQRRGDSLLEGLLLEAILFENALLVGQQEFGSGGEILDIVPQVISARQRLSADAALAANAHEGNGAHAKGRQTTELFRAEELHP